MLMMLLMLRCGGGGTSNHHLNLLSHLHSPADNCFHSTQCRYFEISDSDFDEALGVFDGGCDGIGKADAQDLSVPALGEVSVLATLRHFM